MSPGEVIVWCVGMVCATIVVGVTILAIAFKSSEKKPVARDGEMGEERKGI